MQFRPIERWPGDMTPAAERSSRWSFRANYHQTELLLARELEHLKAENVIIQLALPANKIRRDGFPYADAKPDHPGVILSFESPRGNLSFPCDTFELWQHNLRAIALALEALRKVDRYGVTQNNEQYKGWAKLTGPQPVFATKTDAFEWLAEMIGWNLDAVRQSVRAAYKVAAAKLHPDRNNGDETQFRKLQAAKELLGI